MRPFGYGPYILSTSEILHFIFLDLRKFRTYLLFLMMLLFIRPIRWKQISNSRYPWQYNARINTWQFQVSVTHFSVEEKKRTNCFLTKYSSGLKHLIIFAHGDYGLNKMVPVLSSLSGIILLTRVTKWPFTNSSHRSTIETKTKTRRIYVREFGFVYLFDCFSHFLLLFLLLKGL